MLNSLSMVMGLFCPTSPHPTQIHPSFRITPLTRQGSSAGAPVLTVVRALVKLALVPVVAWLASALGLLAGVQEAAAAIEANQVTSVSGWS